MQFIDTGLSAFLAEYSREELSQIIAQGQQLNWAAELANESSSLDYPYTQEDFLNYLSYAQGEWIEEDSKALDKLLYRADLIGPLAEELREAKIEHKEILPGVFSIAGRVIAQSKNGMIAETTAEIWSSYAKTSDPKGRFLSDAAKKVQHQDGFNSYQELKALDIALETAKKEIAALTAVSVSSSAEAAAHLKAALEAMTKAIADLERKQAAANAKGSEYDALIFNQLRGLIVH